MGANETIGLNSISVLIHPALKSLYLCTTDAFPTHVTMNLTNFLISEHIVPLAPLSWFASFTSWSRSFWKNISPAFIEDGGIEDAWTGALLLFFSFPGLAGYGMQLEPTALCSKLFPSIEWISFLKGKCRAWVFCKLIFTPRPARYKTVHWRCQNVGNRGVCLEQEECSDKSP